MLKVLLVNQVTKETLKEYENVVANHLKLNEKIILNGIQYIIANIKNDLDNSTIKIELIYEGKAR